MKQIVKPEKQKIIIVAVAATVSFFGMQAASAAMRSYQIEIFLAISVYIYLFLIFWQSFIFDLHLRAAPSLIALEKSFFKALFARFEYMASGHHFRHYQNYLLLPGIIFWSTIMLIFLNPFNIALKQTFIFTSSLALTISYWYLKTVFYAHHEQGHFTRQLIFLAKMYAAFTAFVASFGICRYLGFGPDWFAFLIGAVSFLLLLQAFFQHHFIGFESLKFLLVSSAILAALSYFVFIYWSVNYFSGALVLAAIYNTIWGLLHHGVIDKNLTREIVAEYLAVLFVVLVFVFSTTNFSQRI